VNDMAVIYRRRGGSHRARVHGLPAGQLTNRQVWLTASTILAAHSALTGEYLCDDLSEAIGPEIGCENLRRIASAIDTIMMVEPLMPRC
jgi:hypothetical protein